MSSKKTTATRYRIHGIPIKYYDTYTEFYEKNWPVVHKYFIYDMKDYHEAEDITQEIFINVWRFIFEREEKIYRLLPSHQENMTYQVKNIIWSVRSNRQTMLDRRIDVMTESSMFDNPNTDETPLETAVNRSCSVGDPFTESRVYFFVEDLRDAFNDKKVSDMFTLMFLGYSHDEIQSNIKISHGTFYRRYKEHKAKFERVLAKHFAPEEIEAHVNF